MIGNVVHWAKKEASVRAVILTGSRARVQHPEPLSDYDFSVFAEDSSAFTQDEEWLGNLGVVWVCIHEKVRFGEKEFPSRLVIFQDGIKADFIFFPIRVLKDLVEAQVLPDEFDMGYQILIDKDEATTKMPKPSSKIPIPKKPTNEEFLIIVKEFWFEAYHVAVYLKRGQLWLAKSRVASLNHFLLKMIEWNELAKLQWKTPIRHQGKAMQSWVERNTWVALHKVFGHFDSSDSWRSLLHMLRLFRELSMDTAERLEHTYPMHLDNNLSEFIDNLQEKL